MLIAVTKIKPIHARLFSLAACRTLEGDYRTYPLVCKELKLSEQATPEQLWEAIQAIYPKGEEFVFSLEVTT